MKALIFLMTTLYGQASFASDLSCQGDDFLLTATYHGSQREFTNIYIALESTEDEADSYPLAKYDSSYKPRNKKSDMVAYRIMETSKRRSGMTMLLPKSKDSSFKGILVGRHHGYHGEASYEYMSCDLE